MALNMNQTMLDSYNKNTHTGKGTLMTNWHEEQYLRDQTGYGRSAPPQHLPKTHKDLFLKPTNEYPLFQEVLVNPQNTTTRLFGAIIPDVPKPASKYVGGIRNPADDIPKVGRKQQLIEQQYMQQIQSELTQQDKDSFNQTQLREFNSTVKSDFNQKTAENNVIGRRVMRTQNASTIDASKKDVDLLSDFGFYQKPQLSSDAQLQAKLPQESYLTAKPITVYSEKQNQGVFYQSNAVNPERPFHKTDGFQKTFHHFTHVKH